MNYVCVRHEKINTTRETNNKEAEHSRKDHFAQRDNVLAQNSKYNTITSNIKGISIDEMFYNQKKLYEEKNGKKLRKDAVHCIDSVFCRSQCPISEINNMRIAAIKTMQQIAPNCPMRIWTHCDELGECHVHIMTVPIDNNGHCVTDSIMRKESLRNVQDIFAQKCNELGLDAVRGISKEKRFTTHTKQNYHVDNFQFLNSPEGEKWLKEKNDTINKTLARVEEVQEQAKALGIVANSEEYSLDDIIKEASQIGK